MSCRVPAGLSPNCHHIVTISGQAPTIMATLALDQAPAADMPRGPRFDYKHHPLAKLLFVAIMVGGFAFAGWNVLTDTRGVGETLKLGVFAFLGLALLIALGFEFVTGFHDTSTAVRTFI